jgi:hypothetical protein
LTSRQFPTQDVADVLKRFLGPDSWFEIRALGTSTLSGWFDDPVLAAAAARNYDGKFNIYVTANPVCARTEESVNPSSLDRARRGSVTTDADIESRRWLIVDIDHKGKGDQSATDDELAEVGEVANEIATYFSEQRWPSPMLAMSGNGYYLLSRIALSNDDPSRELIRRALHGLNFAFGSEQIVVDESVANAARLVPLFGTMKCKGEGHSTPSSQAVTSNRGRFRWRPLPEDPRGAGATGPGRGRGRTGAG